MRELSACDFCEGEAAGVYEVVPGDIPGVSAHRMVLCDDCRDTLSEIVDPLLEAGRRGGRQRRVADEADTDGSNEPESRTATDSSSSDEAEPSAPEGRAAEGRAAEGQMADATDGSTADGAATADDSASASESAAGETTAGEPSAEASAADSGADSDGSTTSGGPQAEQKRIERPPNYGKVVRLVENREAGIPRADLESLASSAYGISTDEVEQAIETALTEGRFRETDEGLETT